MGVLDWFVILAGLIVLAMGVAAIWPFVDVYIVRRRTDAVGAYLARLHAKQRRGVALTDEEIEGLAAQFRAGEFGRSTPDRQELVEAILENAGPKASRPAPSATPEGPGDDAPPGRPTVQGNLHFIRGTFQETDAGD